MAALDLIKASYDDNSDGESDDGLNETESNVGKQCVLPVPKSILQWKGIPQREKVVSDPSKHGGKIRSFEHERGNWATLVHIKYDPSDAIDLWIKDAKKIIDRVEVIEEFHLSLTRTLVLKFHWIDSFVESIKELCCNTESFWVEITGVNIYVNEEKTRTFLGLRCEDRKGTLRCLTGKLNELLIEYELPPFYEEASFHVSFLWCLGDEEKRFKSSLPLILESFHQLQDKNPEEFQVFVTQIHCKIGNRIYVFRLNR